jgi:hypothetical protein
MADGEGGLSDYLWCRMLRPDCAKACYRQATALMLLKVHLAWQYVQLFQIDLPAVLITFLHLLSNPRSTNKPAMPCWMHKSGILGMQALRVNYGNLLSYAYFECLPNASMA